MPPTCATGQVARMMLPFVHPAIVPSFLAAMPPMRTMPVPLFWTLNEPSTWQL